MIEIIVETIVELISEVVGDSAISPSSLPPWLLPDIPEVPPPEIEWDVLAPWLIGGGLVATAVFLSWNLADENGTIPPTL